MSDNTIIMRAGHASSDLLSAFSSTAKETRLTAFLGYLIAQRVSSILDLFNLNTFEILEVQLEKHVETQRVDIFVISDAKITIIEAKLHYDNPIKQLMVQAAESKRYFPEAEIELIGITNNRFIKHPKVRIITWQGIADSLPASDNQKIKVFTEDFKLTLENRGLAMPEEQYDIYAREVGHIPAATSFLKVHMYFCDYMKNSKVEKCRYFAPHFTAKVATVVPGTRHGVAYLSEIYQVEYIEDIQSFKKLIISHIKRNKLKNAYPEIFDFIDSIEIDFDKPKLVLLLNKPRLVFNPPINKDNLQEGKGFLSKHYYTFEQFFEAAGL